ncbi:MAG TPA: hypothetical protein VHZ95_11485, partial [Polyangiales bacterium]|nr:hypothetical protein [Polyangiales bacterium]
RYSAEALAMRVGESLYDHDTFKGTAAELVASGLARDDMLPGLPGRNKVMQTYDASGAPAIKQDRVARREAGRMSIHRVSKTKFEVWITVSPEERARRDAERYREVEAQHEAKRRACARRDFDRLRSFGLEPDGVARAMKLLHPEMAIYDVPDDVPIKSETIELLRRIARA